MLQKQMIKVKVQDNMWSEAINLIDTGPQGIPVQDWMMQVIVALEGTSKIVTFATGKNWNNGTKKKKNKIKKKICCFALQNNRFSF